jgi:hypothetical protein
MRAKAPGNSDLVPWLGPIFLKKALQYPFRKETIQQWRIAIRRNRKTLKVVTPDSWDGLSGVHTHNWIENIEIIDGRTKACLEDHFP